MAEEEPTTQELRLLVDQRERRERDAADRAPDADAEHAHERRADKARYLRDKLAEREQSEREET